MKRSNWFELSYLALCLLTLVTTYSSAKPYQEIHHLLTDDEREAIFGHPSAEFAPEYEISYPVQVYANGRFLSRDLAHGNVRRKRDIGGSSKESVFFKLSAFGQEYHLNVTLNDELFSPHFKTEVRGKGSSEFHYDIEHCHYLGQLLPKHANKSKVAVSNCDGLQGMILTPRDLLMVHPLPKRLGQEENKTRAHLIHRRSLTLDEETLKNLRRPHILGRRSAEMNFPRLRTIESMIVVEKVMTKFYGAEAIKTYVPTIVNIAHGLLADASIGANIKYIISKLLILTDEDMGGLVLHNHAGTLLTNFCNWTVGQNVGDDSDPAHFDHAALISKYNFCRNKGQNEGEGCGTILGLADLKGMCTPGSSCTLSKDTGLGTAFTMAHETAHNLGSEHDAEGNQCEDGVNIMASKASGKITAFDWSSCSRKYITKFLETAQADCLNDGASNSVPIPSEKPGILYDGNTQCEQMFGKGSRVCDIPDLKAKMCVNLHCEKPDGYCTSNDEPAAEGTECDTNKWCSYGRCVTKGTKGDKDVNGNWGAWGDWSKCFPSCGGGISKRVRKCNNPAPRRGGSLCEGKGTEYRYCYKKCRPNSEHPRMKQCVNKRHVEFDGGPFDWIYDPSFSQDSPKCVLSCATTDGQTTTFGSVRDGTPCSDIPNSGVCINGQCKMVGCDGTVDSRARVDRCGVCNGDGSSCSGDRNQGNKPEPQPTPGAKSIQPISTKSGSPPSTQPTATITVDDKDDGSSEDSDFPDRFRVIDKVKQELDGAAQSSEQLKTKWIISSQGCSVSCGEGIEVITAVCVREDDESAVGDQFCEKKRPGDQFKRCSMQLCPPS